MEPAQTRAVDSIRHFNRYYTNRLGLLSRHRLGSDFTLTEARVLLEIGRRGEHTQGALASGLKIDPGYLNRVVKRLAALGLVERRPQEEDRRVAALTLSGNGRRALEDIDRASDEEVVALIAGLRDGEVSELVDHLRAAERILERRSRRAPTIEAVTGGPGIATAALLMREYASFLGADLTFQGFEEELAELPGKYAPPDGALFIASVSQAEGGQEPAGCVALRNLGDGICEMKRLFVRPEYRGYGLGRLLSERIIGTARELGYRRIRLDTLDRLGEAVALYRGLGFVPIPAYCVNPLPGALFWEKVLREE